MCRCCCCVLFVVAVVVVIKCLFREGEINKIIKLEWLSRKLHTRDTYCSSSASSHPLPSCYCCSRMSVLSGWLSVVHVLVWPAIICLEVMITLINKLRRNPSKRISLSLSAKLKSSGNPLHRSLWGAHLPSGVVSGESFNTAAGRRRRDLISFTSIQSSVSSTVDPHKALKQMFKNSQ